MTAIPQNQSPEPKGRRTAKGHAKSGCRIVHVAVPEPIFNHAKAQAYLSGLPWPRFVERILAEATVLSASSEK